MNEKMPDLTPKMHHIQFRLRLHLKLHLRSKPGIHGDRFTAYTGKKYRGHGDMAVSDESRSAIW